MTTADTCKLSQDMSPTTMENVLIIAPTWQFTRSWYSLLQVQVCTVHCRVYCGRATERLGTITHLSTCNKVPARITLLWFTATVS